MQLQKKATGVAEYRARLIAAPEWGGAGGAVLADRLETKGQQFCSLKAHGHDDDDGDGDGGDMNGYRLDKSKNRRSRLSTLGNATTRHRQEENVPEHLVVRQQSRAQRSRKSC